MLATYQRRPSQREAINAMPLYPTESIMWDESQVGSSSNVAVGASFVITLCRHSKLCLKVGSQLEGISQHHIEVVVACDVIP